MKKLKKLRRLEARGLTWRVLERPKGVWTLHMVWKGFGIFAETDLFQWDDENRIDDVEKLVYEATKAMLKRAGIWEQVNAKEH